MQLTEKQRRIYHLIAAKADITAKQMSVMSEVLNDTQKKNKITNILASMRKTGIIKQGENRQWFLVKRS